MKMKVLMVTAALLVATQAFASESRQLTDKEVDSYIKQGKFGSFSVNDAVSLDGEYAEPKAKFKPFAMSTETNIQEAVWQAMNVVDMLQTIEIAKNPTCYQEVGTLSMLYGNRISKKDAVIGSAIFGVLHYAATRGIESLIDRNPDYRVLQRVWQYTGYGWKGHTLYKNHEIGLRPGSSKLQAGSDGVCRR